ncbi:hypothetical protein, partial [Amycolatopsis sp. NPDC059021]|uniref:hypothetical protein n=1 Tax=Amycolatopsis sp. NPDC059021 TaxID=3346704 RepID=UPI00366E63DE
MRFSHTSRRTYGAALAVAVAAPVCLAPLAQAAPADEPGQLLKLTRQYLQDRAGRGTDPRPAALTGTALTTVADRCEVPARLAGASA